MVRLPDFFPGAAEEVKSVWKRLFPDANGSPKVEVWLRCRRRKSLPDADHACGQPCVVRAGGEGLLVFKQADKLRAAGEASDDSRPQLFDGVA